MGAVGELDLISLLRAGIPVDLAAGRRLFIGALRPKSDLVGATVGARGRLLAGVDTNIIAILRRDEMLVPRADTVLEAGDRLIIVANDDGVPSLQTHLEAW